MMHWNSNTNYSDLDMEDLVIRFNDPTTSRRADILYELNEGRYENIDALLEQAVLDEDELVQIIALQSISRVTEGLGLKLLELFEKSSNTTIVANLCNIFIEFNVVSAIPEIVKKLQSDDQMIIYNCILTLGEMGSESEINVLEKFIESSHKPAIYHDSGILIQSTQHTIGKLSKKSIKKIRRRKLNQFNWD